MVAHNNGTNSFSPLYFVFEFGFANFIVAQKSFKDHDNEVSSPLLTVSLDYDLSTLVSYHAMDIWWS